MLSPIYHSGTQASTQEDRNCASSYLIVAKLPALAGFFGLFFCFFRKGNQEIETASTKKTGQKNRPKLAVWQQLDMNL